MATGRLPDPNTAPLTAKGDLYTYSTVPARLAVGSNGDTLVADSSATTGLRYNPPVGSLANPVINGGMDIWQRGTTATSTANAYTADRWQKGSGTNFEVSRQTTSDTTNLPNIQYALRMQRPNGTTNTGSLNLGQNIETVNSIPFSGKTVTLSFYARAGANWSPTSGNLKISVYTGTGTDQSIMVGGLTGSAETLPVTAALTTTWQRFAGSATIPATATQMAIYAIATPVGTAGANDWCEITGVQIDVGTWTASTAPTFRRSGGTLAGELAACQRYYYRLGGSAWASLGNAVMTSTTIAQSYVGFPQLMRTAPTVNTSGTAADYRVANAVAFTCTAVPVVADASFATPSGITVQYASTGMTANSGAYINLNNNSNAFLAFSAEL